MFKRTRLTPAIREAISEERAALKKRHRVWKRKKRHGDVERIARENNLSRVIVSKAINHGDASYNVLRVVDDYFSRSKHTA